MAEWRALKSKTWRDKKITRLSRGARLLLIGLITLADDQGYLEADAETLRNELYPGDRDLTLDEISEWTAEIVQVDRKDPIAVLYSGDDRTVIWLPKFPEHQPAGVLRKDRRKESKLKALIDEGLLSLSTVDNCQPRLDKTRLEETREKETSASPPSATESKREKTKRSPLQVSNDEIYDAIQGAWLKFRIAGKLTPGTTQTLVTWCKENNRDPEALVAFIGRTAKTNPPIFALKIGRSKELPAALEDGPKLEAWRPKHKRGRRSGTSLGDVLSQAANQRGPNG